VDYIGPEARPRAVIVPAVANHPKVFKAVQISQARKLAASLPFLLSADSTTNACSRAVKIIWKVSESERNLFVQIFLSEFCERSPRPKMWRTKSNTGWGWSS
jgi:hypothetical protein